MDIVLDEKEIPVFSDIRNFSNLLKGTVFIFHRLLLIWLSDSLTAEANGL